jgi:peptide-methionine (R)-S-oxide reductase
MAPIAGAESLRTKDITVTKRRKLIIGLAAGGVLLGGPAVLLSGRRVGATAPAAGGFEVEKPDSEWRQLLTPAQYAVLRGHGTERAGSSPLDGEKRRGTFACAGCALPLFSSDAKFDSGTGWPSFTTPLGQAVATSEDRGLLMIRTEVHCRRCGGHLGHLFGDGPPPTGTRYCMNGVAMIFEAAT